MTTTSTPGVDRDAGRSGARLAPGRSRWQKIIGILGLVVVLWVGDRLYDVIRSGGIGPGGDHQPSGPPSSQPSDRDQSPSGADSGGHDPTRFDHG
jgi:hypothetical protein